MPIRKDISWPNIHGHYHTNHVHTRYTAGFITNVPPEQQGDVYWTWIYSTLGKDWDNTTGLGYRDGASNSITYWFPQGWYMQNSAGGLSVNQKRIGGPHNYWPEHWLADNEIEDVTKMEGFEFDPLVAGGGEDDERIWGIQRGCETNLNCASWAQGGEPWAYTVDGHGTETIYYINHENPENFYGINCVHLTSGGTDLVGDLVQSGQAQGKRILSHTGIDKSSYSIGGNDHSGSNYEIDCAPGRGENSVLLPFEDEIQTKGIDNIFNMKDYGHVGKNSFFMNLTFYPRIDPHGTYSGIYQKINDEDSEEKYFRKNLTDKYCFESKNASTSTITKYSWIPHLARATGYIGGYLWHTIKQLSNTGIHPKDGLNDFHIRDAYRDIGVNYDGLVKGVSDGKDGIGRFFNFTGEEAKVCNEPGANLETVIQHASGLVYTGHNINYTGGVNYNWSKRDFSSGDFRAFLEDIVNYDAPEGMLAPSTGIVNQIARLFERKEPTGMYSGQENWNICQDPMTARPSAIKITWKPNHRGSAHAALFIEPANYENRSWDFDFSGFQIGDGIIGVHSGRTSNDLSRDQNREGGYGVGYALPTENQNLPFHQALKRGNGVLKYDNYGREHVALTDGWYPVSHFYHHDLGVDSENVFKDVYEYAPAYSYYNYNTGIFKTNWGETPDTFSYHGAAQSSPWNKYSDHPLPAPFTNYSVHFSPSTHLQNWDTEHNSVCYHTYIPVDAGFQYVDKPLGQFLENNIRYGVPIKACGHRFMSGIRFVGVVGDEEQSGQVLPYTRNRRTVPSGGINSDVYSRLNYADAAAVNSFIETGQIVPPKFELSLPWGDIYSFNISGWANYCFPQDRSKPVQYITGFPFNCSKTEVVKPRIRKWFCPVDKTSISAAKSSEVQEINFSASAIGGDQSSFFENACILEPPVYKYNIKIINGSWAYIDGSKSSPGPYLKIYNEKDQDIESLFSNYNSNYQLGHLGENFTEGEHEFYCGDVISKIDYFGKVIDGYGYGTHSDTNWDYIYENEHKDGYVYVGDPGHSAISRWTTGTHTHVTNVGCTTDNTKDTTLSHSTSFTGSASQLSYPSEISRKIHDIQIYKQPEVDESESAQNIERYPLDSAANGKPEPKPSNFNKEVRINFQIEQHNRGMVHFDCGESFLTGNNDAGINFIGSGGILDSVTPNGSTWGRVQGGIYTENWTGNYGGVTGVDSYTSFTFIREWTIRPKNTGIHADQTFSMPYCYVYREPTLHSWSEPEEQPAEYGGGWDGGYKVRGADGEYYEVGTAEASGQERIQAHYITQAFCPVIFHFDSGSVHNLVKNEPGWGGWGLESSADSYPSPGSSFSDEVYHTPVHQMPFNQRPLSSAPRAATNNWSAEYKAQIGNRFYQEFPVVFEYTNYGNFENLGPAANQQVHSFDGVQGTFKGSERLFQDEAMQGFQNAFYSPVDHQSKGFLDPIYNAHAMEGVWNFSRLAKEYHTFTWYDGSNNNFVLRLVQGLTYEVIETTYVYCMPAYALTDDGNWFASQFDNSHYIHETAINTRTGYFQTYGSKFLSNQKQLEDNLGVSDENVDLEILYQTQQGNTPHVSGYIQYAETLDKNLCTFNVRSKNPSPIHDGRKYIQPATGSYNCDAGTNKDEHILLPCFDTINVEYDQCTSGTYKGMPYQSCVAKYKPNKSVLNAGMYEAEMMSLIDKQHDLSSVNLDGIDLKFEDLRENISVNTCPALQCLQNFIIRGNKKAFDNDDYDFFESGYKFGVAESYTTLELGASEQAFFTGEAGEFTGRWHSYGQLNNSYTGVELKV